MPTLQWLTRDEDLRAAGRTPYRLLKEVPELGHGDRDAGNMLIQGDNLEALKSLLPFYAGRVKCIYIDPPYNTRSAAIEQYNDSLEHSQWLALMWPRLELLRELLSEDGSIWVSIDDNEGHYLKIIMDEVFGRKNRVNIVSVKMSEASGVKMAHVDSRLPKLKEYVFGYQKGNLERLDVDLVEIGVWNEEYKTILEGLTREEVDSIRSLRDKEVVTTNDVAEVNAILSKATLISASQFTEREELTREAYQAWRRDNAWRVVQAVGSSSVFRLALADKKRKQEIAAVRSTSGLMYLYKVGVDPSAKQPRVQIIFADESLFQNPGDLWLDIKTTGGVGQEGGVLFPNGKKPEKLLWRIINMVTNPGDLVLDSFLGSGTTAAVAQKMGRRYIGIEIGDHAVTHAQPRLCNVVKGEQGGISKAQGWTGGGGFRFYRLGPEVFGEDGAIRADIDFETLAAHVWFSETEAPWDGVRDGPWLGARGEHGVALLYNGVLGDKRAGGGNVLTREVLATIRAAAARAGFAGPTVVYGVRSALSPATLAREGVTFKQTPYDVRARR